MTIFTFIWLDQRGFKMYLECKYQLSVVNNSIGRATAPGLHTEATYINCYSRPASRVTVSVTLRVARAGFPQWEGGRFARASKPMGLNH